MVLTTDQRIPPTSSNCSPSVSLLIRTPIDLSEFEGPRPSSPIRSRSSPDKKPICSGFINFHSNNTPSTNHYPHQSPSPRSASRFTPTRKVTTASDRRTSLRTNPLSGSVGHRNSSSLILSGTALTPAGSPGLNPHRTSIFSPPPRPARTDEEGTQRISSFLPGPEPSRVGLGSSSTPSMARLRARVTKEAIPRKKPMLPGAPNPDSNHHYHHQQQPRPTTITTTSSSSQSSHPNTPITLFHSPSSTTIKHLLPPTIESRQENVSVSVRIKPNHHHNQANKVWEIDSESNTLCQINLPSAIQSSSASQWSFDSVLGPECKNSDVYNQSGARDLILSAMSGYDATIFTYGQTASGKTHTLTGDDREPGVIPLSVHEIFNYIRTHPERDFLIRVSYLEIYNEQINDLLSLTGPGLTNIRIRQESRTGDFYPDPIREELITTYDQIQNSLDRGDRKRHCSSTDFNSRSSRSHTIFSLVIESKPAIDVDNSDYCVMRSKVSLIDLAGNEKACSEIHRRNEGAFINKSLLTLEKVISALTEKKRATYIPFRESKLTQILQRSLTGQSRVCMICTINSTVDSIEESKSTLRFASRVKTIQVDAGRKEILSEKALITRYRQQILDLQNQLTAAINNPDGANLTLKTITEEQDEASKKAEEERQEILKRLNNLQNIVLNANNLNEFNHDRETRAVSPVKQGRYQEFSDDDDDGTLNDEEVEEAESEEKQETNKQKNLEMEIEELRIQNKFKDHRIERLEYELKKYDKDGEKVVEDIENEQICLEAEFRKLKDENLSRKKFSEDVVRCLEESRAKTKKLELFVINELQRSMKKLDRQQLNVRGKGRGSGRRRSSSLGGLEERDEVEKMLLIFNEVPELESIRMSYLDHLPEP